MQFQSFTLLALFSLSACSAALAIADGPQMASGQLQNREVEIRSPVPEITPGQKQAVKEFIEKNKTCNVRVIMNKLGLPEQVVMEAIYTLKRSDPVIARIC